MSKKTHWETVATFKLGDFHDFVKDCAYTPTEKQYKDYRKRMYKWGIKVSKLPIEKVNFNKKKEAAAE